MFESKLRKEHDILCKAVNGLYDRVREPHTYCDYGEAFYELCRLNEIEKGIKRRDEKIKESNKHRDQWREQTETLIKSVDAKKTEISALESKLKDAEREVERLKEVHALELEVARNPFVIKPEVEGNADDAVTKPNAPIFAVYKRSVKEKGSVFYLGGSTLQSFGRALRGGTFEIVEESIGDYKTLEEAEKCVEHIRKGDILCH